MTSLDTIAALATPAGRGAVAVVRISGPAVPAVGAALCGALPAPRVAALRRFCAADGSVLDAGLAVYFPAPASFTGEHVLELQGHGGTVVAELLLQRVLELGARLARPGEFSERAFLNGKLDLAQAEAVADLICASSAQAAQAAVRSMQGEFSARIRELQDALMALRVFVEAAIDFPDEEVDLLDSPALQSRLSQLFALFDGLSSAARQGVLLRDGVRIVIAGKPNAGKSSLLNRLVGDAVAIVTDLPGTTRDVLRHRIHVDGLPVTLLDTAGLRPPADVVEGEGIRRARNEMAHADRVLYIVDAGGLDAAASRVEFDADDLPPGVPVTLVLNKIDLLAGVPPPAPPDLPMVCVSARTGAGIAELLRHLKSAAGYGAAEGTFSARQRHVEALRLARDAVQRAAEVLQRSAGFELFAEDLRLAQHHLGAITGEVSSDELLGEIFANFCIGK